MEIYTSASMGIQCSLIHTKTTFQFTSDTYFDLRTKVSMNDKHSDLTGGRTWAGVPINCKQKSARPSQRKQNQCYHPHRSDTTCQNRALRLYEKLKSVDPVHNDYLAEKLQAGLTFVTFNLCDGLITCSNLALFRYQSAEWCFRQILL